MRLASKINDAVFATIPSLVREGMTENELSALLSQQYKQLGDPTAPTAGGLICFGESAAEPHHSNSERKLKPGDVILIDAGQRSYGYNSDMTRTFFYKTISKEQEEVYQIVKQANELAEAAIKPGVKLKDIDAAARSHIASFGYGEQFTHRTGHNIGLSVHEEPSVSAVCEVPAQEGMTFSIEPGIYLPGQFGVRVEDLILVTKDGCEVLNAYSKEIQVIG
jgi:Xaa-Pro dipeptidase